MTIKEPADKENPTHYVNNKEFYNALVEYRKVCERAEQLGLPRPIIPDYIGDCFIKIARGVAMKYNFRNYSYINDMISTGIEVCVQRIMSFDPTKSTSPFSYFTQVVWFAFINIIKIEKKQSVTKRKAFLLGGFDSFDLDLHDEDGNFNVSYVDYIRSLGEGLEDEIKPKESKKKKKQEPMIEFNDE